MSASLKVTLMSNDNLPTVSIALLVQPRFSIIEYGKILKWSWDLSPKDFCTKMKQEIAWQSTPAGFAATEPVSTPACQFSRFVDVDTREEWLWLAGRLQSLSPLGSFEIRTDVPIDGLTREQINLFETKAAAGEYSFIKAPPHATDADRPLDVQQLTHGGFVMPESAFAQERLQYVIRQDPHALLATPTGVALARDFNGPELGIYSMTIDDDLISVLMHNEAEILDFDIYDVMYALHMRGRDMTEL